MLLPALLPALGVFGLSLAAILALLVAAPHELAPLPTSDAEMRRFAEAGFFPLAAAAGMAQRHGLAAAAELQTFGALAVMFFAAAYAAWRGFESSRTRGWSQTFWIAGVVLLCFAPSVFHGLTPKTLDYLITASESGRGLGLPSPLSEIWGPTGLNHHMLPAAFLAERGIVGGALAAFFALLAHDLAYRLREAMEDFGFIDIDEDRHRSARPSRGAGKGGGPGRRAAYGEPQAEQAGGFGQRSAPPPPGGASVSEDARARAVLGVSLNATRREIERAYRSQMKRAHPDHGGSVERAAALNAARDALLRRG